MDQRLYIVVKNDENQHSIWACDLPVPAGWIVLGNPATQETCLEYIRVNWTDMTPASTRRTLGA